MPDESQIPLTIVGKTVGVQAVTSDIQNVGKAAEGAQTKARILFDQLTEGAKKSGTEFEKEEAAWRKRLGLIDQAIKEDERRTQAFQRESDKRSKILEREAAQAKKLQDEALASNRKQLENMLGGGGGGGGSDSSGGGGIPGFGASLGALGGLGRMFGIAGGSFAGYQIFREVSGAIRSMVMEAVNGAREIDQFAKAMGTTALQADRMRIAVTLAGESASLLQRAAGRISVASEDPTGGGRRGARALQRLGIQTEDDQGKALEPGEVTSATLSLLQSIGDANVRNTALAEIFGRTMGTQLTRTVAHYRELVAIGKEFQSVDFDAQQKSLMNMDASFHIVSENFKMLGRTLTVLFEPALEGLANFLTMGKSAKMIAEMNKEDDGNDDVYGTEPGGKSHSVDLKIRQQYKNLTGVKVNRNRFTQWYESHTEEGKRLKLADLESDSKELTDEIVKLGPGQEAENTGKRLVAEQAKIHAQIEKLKAELKKPGAAKRDPEAHYRSSLDALEMEDRYPSILYGREGSVRSAQSRFLDSLDDDPRLSRSIKASERARAQRLYGERLKQAQDEQHDKTLELYSYLGRTKDVNRNERIKEEQYGLGLNLHENAEDMRFQHQMRNQQLGQGAALLVGQTRTQGQLSQISGRATIGSEYSSAVELAQKLFGIRMQTASAETDIHQKALEQQKAYGDLVEANQTAELGRAVAIAQVNRQQKEETAGFFTGLFNAGINGDTSKYLSGFGRSIATTVVGNFSKNYLGSFQEHLGLNRTGAMGTASNPNMLGKLLKGTPLDFTGDQQGANGKDAPLITSQGALKTSIDYLRGAVMAAAGMGSGTGGGGGYSGGGGGWSGGGTWGGSGGDILMGGDGLPAIGFGSGSSGASMGSAGLPGLGGFSSRLGRTVSGLAGGAGYAAGGYGLLAALRGGGGVDLGGGHGAVLSGTERIGAGLGLAGGEAGAVMGALSGFGQGGARGDLKGIGSALGGASLLAGPFAPFLQAAGLVTGLVSSLFGDPRENRQKAENKALLYNRYIDPAAHDYSMGVGGGGVDFSGSGTLRSGAPTANYTVNVSAMDSHGVYQAFRNNPQAISDSVALTLGQSGSAALGAELAYHLANP